MVSHLYIDMNSYFASVEQQANPLFRGKPLGVCAYLSDNGCIIASSKEAKKVGIKTGCNVRDAKKLYPGVILVENEPAKYRSTTQKIFQIYAQYTDRVEPYSIDEAFLDLTGYVKSWKGAQDVFLEIKERIKNEVGEWLTCSGGIASTRWLAKFASDVAKANEYHILDSKNKIEELLGSVVMTDAWGIGERMKERLNQLGIYTLIDLKNYPVANILRILGKPGYYLWAHVNGIEVEEVKTQEELLPKTIGHSYCIPKQTNDASYLSSILMKLCEKTGRRLRENNFEALNIHAGYTLVNGGSFFKSKKQIDPLYTTQDIFLAAYGLLHVSDIESRVRMLAVSVGALRPYSGQLHLFDDVAKKRRLSDALDQLNSRYSEYLVYPGRMFGTKEQAHDRVGFRKSVEVKGKNDMERYVDEF